MRPSRPGRGRAATARRHAVEGENGIVVAEKEKAQERLAANCAFFLLMACGN